MKNGNKCDFFICGDHDRPGSQVLQCNPFQSSSARIASVATQKFRTAWLLEQWLRPQINSTKSLVTINFDKFSTDSTVKNE